MHEVIAALCVLQAWMDQGQDADTLRMLLDAGASINLRNPITGAKLPPIPWGQAGTPFAACAGKAAMRKLIFSAGHARKMSDEIRQKCSGGLDSKSCPA